MVVEVAVEFEKVGDGVGDEKVVMFDEFSLLGSIFAFFLFPEISGSCDMNRRVGELISACWNILVSVLVPVAAVEAGRMVGVRAADD